MKKFLPQIVCLSGLLVVLVGFAVGPVVPYQDPTPEMLALEARQEQRSQRVIITGLILIAGGGLWGVSHWLTRRFSQRTAI